MSDDPIDVVQRFCDTWATGDLDAIMGFLAEDAVYHNIPVEPVQGHEAIRTTIEGFTAGVDRIEFEVKAIAAAGGVVLTERVDTFHRPAGDPIVLPVMGTFEVAGGTITAWRDYFDLNQFLSQVT